MSMGDSEDKDGGPTSEQSTTPSGTEPTTTLSGNEPTSALPTSKQGITPSGTEPTTTLPTSEQSTTPSGTEPTTTLSGNEPTTDLSDLESITADESKIPHSKPPSGESKQELFAGRYQILDMLGEGAMGRVYRAHDSTLDREVAIKTLKLPQGMELTDEYIENLRNEGKAQAKVSHPNVITIHDSGVTDRTPFIIVDYIRGKTLENICQNEEVSNSYILKGFEGALKGLNAIHEKEFLHRDLKPANIMVKEMVESLVHPSIESSAEIESSPENYEGNDETIDMDLDATKRDKNQETDKDDSDVHPVQETREEKQIKEIEPSKKNSVREKYQDWILTDFGLSASKKSLAKEYGAISGTPRYMSPEQASGEPLDQRSDIFSMGLILYRLYTNDEPRKERDLSKRIEEAVKGGLPEIKERRYSREKRSRFYHFVQWRRERWQRKSIETLIKKATAKDPNNRWQSVAEMIKYITYRERTLHLKDVRLNQLKRRVLPIATAVLTIGTLTAWYAIRVPIALNGVERDLMYAHKQEANDDPVGTSSYLNEADRRLKSVSWSLPATSEERRDLEWRILSGMLQNSIERGHYKEARRISKKIGEYRPKNISKIDASLLEMRIAQASGKTEEEVQATKKLERIFNEEKKLEEKLNEEKKLEEKLNEEKKLEGIFNEEQIVSICRALGNQYLRIANKSTSESEKELYLRKIVEISNYTLYKLDKKILSKGFPTANEERDRVMVILLKSAALRLNNDINGAESGYEKAMTIARHQGNFLLGGVILNSQSIMEYNRKKLKRAKELSEEAVKILKKGLATSSNRRYEGAGALARAEETLANILSDDLDDKASLEHINKAISIYEELGNTRDLVSVMYNMNQTLVNLGRFEEAERGIKKGITLSKMFNNQYYSAAERSLLGDISLERGMYEEAVKRYEEAWNGFGTSRESDELAVYAKVQEAYALARTGNEENVRRARLMLRKIDHVKGMDFYNRGTAIVVEALLDIKTNVGRDRLEQRVRDMESERKKLKEFTDLNFRILGAESLLQSTLGNRAIVLSNLQEVKDLAERTDRPYDQSEVYLMVAESYYRLSEGASKGERKYCLESAKEFASKVEANSKKYGFNGLLEEARVLKREVERDLQ